MTDPYGPPPSVPAEPVPEAPPAAPRRGWVVTALVGVAALVVGVLVGGAAVSAYDHRDDIATTVSTAGLPSSGRIDSGTLEPGSCFAELPASQDEDTVGDVRAQDCAKPHESQVYATFNLDDGAFPGDDAIGDLAEEGCTKRWQENDALTEATNADQMRWFTPTMGSWEANRDRYVACFVIGPPAELSSPLPIASA